MYQISFYVPESHLEQVKNAMFEKGAGEIGFYSHCAWETKGQGQYKPLTGSQPFLGEQDKLEKAPEYKVELVCEEKYLSEVIVAMKSAHPYEEPAYFIVEMKKI